MAEEKDSSIFIGRVQNKDMFFGADPVMEDSDPTPTPEPKKDVEVKEPKSEELQVVQDDDKEGDIFFQHDLEKPKDIVPLEGSTIDEGSDDSTGGEEVEDDTDYAEIVRRLVKAGEWEEFVMEGEDGDIPISDLQDLSKDDFQSIAKQQKKARRDKEKAEIDAQFTESEREMLKFKEQGGNMEQYLQTFTFRQSAGQIPIQTPEQQNAIIASYQKNILGYPDAKIQKNLSRLTDAAERLEEAEFAKEKITEVAKKQHQDLVAAQQAQADRIVEAEENYKNSLKNKFKQTGLDTKEASAIVRAFTTKDERGYTEADIAYLRAKSDPERVEMLYKFLTDPENFAKHVSQKKVNEEKLNTFKGLKWKPSNSSKQTDSQRKTNPRDRKELFINIPDKG